MRCSTINLGISDYDILNPVEVRYITNKGKNKKLKEIKVIPCNYTIWDHIDIKGPNITIRELINNFKLLFILSVIGVMSSIVGIVTALNGGSGRRIVIILSIIALIVNIVIFALSGYILLHNIWSIP